MKCHADMLAMVDDVLLCCTILGEDAYMYPNLMLIYDSEGALGWRKVKCLEIVRHRQTLLACLARMKCHVFFSLLAARSPSIAELRAESCSGAIIHPI